MRQFEIFNFDFPGGTLRSKSIIISLVVVEKFLFGFNRLYPLEEVNQAVYAFETVFWKNRKLWQTDRQDLPIKFHCQRIKISISIEHIWNSASNQLIDLISVYSPRKAFSPKIVECDNLTEMFGLFSWFVSSKNCKNILICIIMQTLGH